MAMEFKTRREALTGLAVAAASPLAVSGVSAQTTTSPQRNNLLPATNVCSVTAQAILGPYYFDPKLVRTDIKEDRTGVPLAIHLQVVEANCAPVAGARVDIWQADALGIYSGYDGQSDAGNVSTKGKTFLRGTQFSDQAGVVRFSSIYPGWYKGRTTHVHFKVFLSEREVLVSQMYFPDALNEFIYTTVGPYNTRTATRDTVNRTDFVRSEDENGVSAICSIREEADSYVASLILGVDRQGKPSGKGPPPGFTGPPPTLGPRPADSAALVPGGAKK